VIRRLILKFSRVLPSREWRLPSRNRNGHDGASESCIRQAATTSQIIHARFTTQASTIAIDWLGEKASVPATPGLHQVGQAGDLIR
jgi:hypothetical protein